ncbi:MAG: glutathione S-transferase [Arenicella sp.]|jgi:glutathione S-transferase
MDLNVYLENLLLGNYNVNLINTTMMKTKMKLWHCHNARSLRPLWALEEMGLEYDLEVLPFPPRFFKKEYLETNLLGTIPYFSDGETLMTESTGICHYLVEKYQQNQLSVSVDSPEYGSYLNWLYHSDATLTFPQTLYLRYTQMEPEERRQPQVAEDYRKWYLARLRLLDEHIKKRKFLCDERFTIADIAVGYALFLGELQGFAIDYTPQVIDYLHRLTARPAFIKAVALTE